MPLLQDHPLRYAMANELHARPFPVLDAPGQAAYLAIKQPTDAAARDREADHAHLIDLLDRFGAKHPAASATHYFGELGRFKLKWEAHTEFVTYTLFVEGEEGEKFAEDAFDLYPRDWLDRAPGVCISSALIRADRTATEGEILDRMNAWFVGESLAASRILDGAAVVAGDFRIDSAGHMRFAIFAAPDTGGQRIGRIVQRICEIETYKAMSMLGFARVRDLSSELGRIDRALEALIEEMAGQAAGLDETLTGLLRIASELERLTAKNSFRFSATAAYKALVTERIAVLREERFHGRQTFAEFMARRFDPAMRTVRSTETRMQTMTARANRAGELLRTRVDVDRSAQNQALLESMDRRADLQLRLQKTVEGLSVVAISYYAVNLVSYVTYPLANSAGMSKEMLTAALVLPVVAGVWWAVHRIRRLME